jgi:hypothetical protein
MARQPYKFKDEERYEQKGLFDRLADEIQKMEPETPIATPTDCSSETTADVRCAICQAKKSEHGAPNNHKLDPPCGLFTMPAKSSLCRCGHLFADHGKSGKCKYPLGLRTGCECDEFYPLLFGDRPKFWLEFTENVNKYRIVMERREGTLFGPWFPYQGVAVLKVGHETYVALSEFWEGVDVPINTVLKLNKVDDQDVREVEDAQG